MAGQASQSKWFSTNPDKAWGEKLFLINAIIVTVALVTFNEIGWANAGDFWNIMQNLLVWIPYMVILPLVLRRNSGVPWYDSYWFKVNLYMMVAMFFGTYFWSEYYFKIMGMRYNFPNVSWGYLDSALCGPEQATALAQHQRVPLGMYFNTVACVSFYFTVGIVFMRRARNLAASWGLSASAQKVVWAVVMILTSVFFAWYETFVLMGADHTKNVYYETAFTMASFYKVVPFYSFFFLLGLPNFFRIDETADAKWNLKDCFVNASCLSIWVLLLMDLWAHIFGTIGG